MYRSLEANLFKTLLLVAVCYRFACLTVCPHFTRPMSADDLGVFLLNSSL